MDLSKTYNLQKPVLEWLINGENTDRVRREVKYGKLTVNPNKREVIYKGNLKYFLNDILIPNKASLFKDNVPQNIRITIPTVMRDLNKVNHPDIVMVKNKGDYLIIKTHESVK